jgi:tetratricopeptide (TPR) repeat protein
MRMSAFVIAIVAVTASTAAAQGVTVIGGGQARACYTAARMEGPDPRAVQVCDSALAHELLRRRDRAATHVNRGILLLRERDGARALADFDAAIALMPNLAEGHVNRGAALILLDRPRDAIAALNRGLEKQTAEPWTAHFNRATAREMLGDISGAYADLQQAAGLNPTWDLPKKELERYRVIEREQETGLG